jgi:hypothetical protein
MRSMKLIAITELRYAGVNYFPGDPFEGSDNDALLLKTIGKAKDAPAAPVEAKTAKAATQVEQPATKPAQADAFGQAAEDKPAGRRRYLRRDMSAEGSDE